MNSCKFVVIKNSVLAPNFSVNSRANDVKLMYQRGKYICFNISKHIRILSMRTRFQIYFQYNINRKQKIP